jgi:UDP-N-acetylmuramoyl-L-alanyl-D-glutamate--2,6-diaminopimelate ligase
MEALERGGDGNPRVTDVTYDSRAVRPGTIFVAIPGLTAHGDTFIADALDRGAVAVVSENAHPRLSAPWIRVANARQTLGELARIVYGADTDATTMVGITGTNGKTTVGFLFDTLFSEHYGRERSWLFGTISYAVGGTLEQASRTTPESCEIFRHIGTAELKPRAITMEVSSHSLWLDRVAGLRFDCAVWTNLTQDHLDFHETMESYYQAKKLLFCRYLLPHGTAVINVDDPWGSRLAGELEDVATVTYGTDSSADFRIVHSKCDWTGTEIQVHYNGKEHTFETCLSGQFNVYNLAAFCAGALGLGHSGETIHKSLQRMRPVAGRMERVETGLECAVVVDYAHTPDALVNVLRTARALTPGRLYCVFGCGGDRDRSKRPIMAAAVAEQCDEAIVTSDNPRGEDPEAIIDEIVPGIPLDFPSTIVVDRRNAIAAALRRAGKGDCVVIAGKGHETYQEANGVRHHFDDREVAREVALTIKEGRHG